MSLVTRIMLRRLRGRKLSMALSSFIIAWALAMMVAGLYSSEVIEYSASSYLEDSGMPDLLVSLYDDRLPDEINGTFEMFPVRAIDLRLREVGQIMLNGTMTQVTVIGLSDPARTDISRLTVLEGRLFSSPFEGVVMAGSAELGNSVHLAVNGTSLDLDLTGVVRSPEYLFNELQAGAIVSGMGSETIIFVPLSTLRSVTGGGINDIALMLGDVSKEETAAALASLPVSSMTFREDHPTVVLVHMGADKMSTMLPSISMVFVLIGAVSIFITMYRMVVSDSRNMGVLMSLGMGKGRIASSYLGMGVVTVVVGVVLGSILGYGFTVAIASLALQMMGDIPVVMPLSIAPFLIGSLLTLLLVMAATLIPVALVLRQDIREALSYVPRSRFWTWRGSTRSLATSLGARNLLREPRRAATVMIAIALTVGAAGSWLVMLDSSLGYIDEQSDSYQWDVAITFTSPSDAGQAIARYSSADVKEVMPYIALSGLASIGERSTGAMMTASANMSAVRSFELRSGSLDFNGAVIAKKLADELRGGPGSALTLAFGGRMVNLTVTGIVDDLQTNAVYTSNGEAASVMGPDLCQGVYVSLTNSDLTPGFISSLYADPLVAGAEARSEVVGSIQGLLASALNLFYAYFALNLLIALAVATSAVVVSTSERDLEFTAVASLGLPRSFVVKSLMVEVGLLSLISALLAIPFALVMAQGFETLMEEAVFFIPIGLTLASALTILTVGWLFTVPSVIWPIRWIKRMDIGGTLRERLH